ALARTLRPPERDARGPPPPGLSGMTSPRAAASAADREGRPLPSIAARSAEREALDVISGRRCVPARAGRRGRFPVARGEASAARDRGLADLDDADGIERPALGRRLEAALDHEPPQQRRRLGM